MSATHSMCSVSKKQTVFKNISGLEESPKAPEAYIGKTAMFDEKCSSSVCLGQTRLWKNFEFH